MHTQQRIKALVLLVAFYSCYIQTVHAGVLVVFDLSTANEMTVTAADGYALADVTGHDATGVYFENFFSNTNLYEPTWAAWQDVTTTSPEGHFTYFWTHSGNNPQLFRGDGIETGLNIKLMTGDLGSETLVANAPINANSSAFKGSTTFKQLSENFYQALTTAPATGNIYAFAAREHEVGSATLIGEYVVVNTSANVPEPSTAIAMGLLGIVGFAGNRRRRRQESVA